MKKIYIFLILLTVIFVPLVAHGALVTCKGPTDCTLDAFFDMLGTIYTFIVKDIATPLAVIAIIVGAILMMSSAGNPNQMALGKKVFWSAVIGLVLVYGSYLIVKTILEAMGSSVKI